jgi:hypothetical protein
MAYVAIQFANLNYCCCQTLLVFLDHLFYLINYHIFCYDLIYHLRNLKHDL